MEITVAQKVIPNWRYGGAAAKLRLVLSQRIVTSDSKILMPGNTRDKKWYRDIPCTISGTDLTIPEFTIDSTTDSSNPRAAMTAIFFDAAGNRELDFFLANFQVPTVFGSAITWQQLDIYNSAKPVANSPSIYINREDTIKLINNLSGGVAEGNKGDITVSEDGTIWNVNSGLDAEKIADGSVSNAEFQFLNGVTSSIQTQLGNKQISLGFTPENAANKNQVGGYAGLDVSGKLDAVVIPALKSHEFLTVANQAVRLALTSSQIQPGDEVFQTETGETYKLVASDPSLTGSWKVIADTTPDYSTIQNKPAFGTASLLDAPASGNAASGQLVKGSDTRLLPAGGTAHQILEKINNVDYNVQWVDAPAGAGGGGDGSGEIPFEEDDGTQNNIPIAGGSSGGGGGAVDSVNGYDGPVVLVTDDIQEPVSGATNLWFTASRVRSTVLTGLSLLVGGVIASGDTVLQALGKLQKSITDNAAAAQNPANITQDSTHRFVSDTQTATWNAKQNALGFSPENSANKNQNNGYAGLDSSGLIPSALLPSFVDDVIEATNFSAFPGTGATGKIYVTLDNNKTFRWSGSAYIEISASPGSTDSVTEGSLNKYFTEPRVLNTLLAGLSTAANAVITTADSALSALGKIQAQINAYKDASLTFTGKTMSGASNTFSNIPSTAITGLGSLATLSAVGSSQISAAAITPPKIADAVEAGVSGGVAVINASLAFTYYIVQSEDFTLSYSNEINFRMIRVIIADNNGSGLNVSLSSGIRAMSDVNTSLLAIPAWNWIHLLMSYNPFFGKMEILSIVRGGS